MSKSAALLGATGLVGHYLLHELLQDPQYQKVTVFTRRPLPIQNPKIREVQGDLQQASLYEDTEVDDVFCAIGTTRAKTPDLQAYRAIDYGIPLTAGRRLRQQGAQRFLLVSSQGANPHNKIFYSRLKGQVERDLGQQEWPELYLFRPSFIRGQRGETRWGEWLGKGIMKGLGPLLPGRYQAIEASTIARSMLAVANQNAVKPGIIEGPQMKALLS